MLLAVKFLLRILPKHVKLIANKNGGKEILQKENYRILKSYK